jgi:hypothetical protein
MAGDASGNLLDNGGFQDPATPAFFYYDNNTGNTGTAFDVPGWEAFANVDPSSWVLISFNSPVVGNVVLDLSGSDSTATGFVGLAGIQTAVGSRPPVTPGTPYKASVTFDDYFAPAGISYFIDWFDIGGSLISSDGGDLGDPNGPLTYEPLVQTGMVAGIAPANAVTAGVRFQSENGLFAGAQADNFSLVPEPSSLVLTAVAALALLRAVSRRRTYRFGACV